LRTTAFWQLAMGTGCLALAIPAKQPSESATCSTEPIANCQTLRALG